VKHAERPLRDRLTQVQATKDQWIKYTLGEQAVELLEERFLDPQSTRMHHVAIIAETNSGKTTIAERFLRRHPDELHIAEPSIVSVLKVEATRADEDRFYNKILEELPVYKTAISARTAQKEVAVMRALRDCSVRMLIIDEFHNLLRATPGKQRDFMIVLKTLANYLKITIVVIGLPEVFNALQTDRQIASRFPYIVFLPKWQLDAGDDPNKPSEYRRFLAAFERLLPFDEPLDLGDNPMAQEIFALSEGALGEATDLIRMAAEFVLKAGRENVSVRDLSACGYVPPGRRAFPPDLGAAQNLG
jgi:hypothetical protein